MCIQKLGASPQSFATCVLIVRRPFFCWLSSGHEDVNQNALSGLLGVVKIGHAWFVTVRDLSSANLVSDSPDSGEVGISVRRAQVVPVVLRGWSIWITIGAFTWFLDAKRFPFLTPLATYFLGLLVACALLAIESTSKRMLSSTKL
jgi:hypothetical protein